MPFCCIALVGIALIYFALLWLRHLFSGPRRDRVSSLPVPPRALTGNGATPVWGHTWLFAKTGSDLALRFPPDMREWRWLPKFASRPLGQCFSVFLWGHWRVIIRGPELAVKVLDSVGLQEGWAWSAPRHLLGNSCLPLLEEEDADFLVSLIQRPLSHESVVRFAPEFADLAEKYVDDLLAGKFKRHNDSPKKVGDSFDSGEFGANSDEEMGWKLDAKSHKIKWDSLRSFTLDLIDGPLLNLNVWGKEEQSNGGVAESPTTLDDEGKRKKIRIFRSQTKQPPSRDRLLLWMERVKSALLVVKMTWGAEWAQMWRLNEYGRAVNGRMHLEKLLSRHVAKQQQLVPIPREVGHTIHEPMAMPFPWLTMAENMYYNYKKFQITSSAGRVALQNRPRTLSAPEVLQERHEVTYDGSFDVPPPPPRPTSPRTLDTEQDLHHAEYIASPATSPRHSSIKRCTSSPVEGGRKTLPSNKQVQFNVEEKKKPERRRVTSLLEQFLRQKDSEGTGMTQAVVTEICFLLWMMLDAGNAWSAMALHLLASDDTACSRVQEELDHLVSVYGKGNIFVPSVLKKMTALDAVLYEAIRLCPPFLGGLKKTSQTMELPEVGVQIPKNTNVVFCQPTKEPFDMTKAWGQQPQNLGASYPCLELHGFLPFQGLEVPLMVLQSKVFLAVLMQRCSPFLSKRRTFIRKVRETLSLCTPNNRKDSKDGDSSDEFFNDESGDLNDAHDTVADDEELALKVVQPEMTQTEAMRLFTKIPFPEPRRVINVKLRADSR